MDTIFLAIHMGVNPPHEFEIFGSAEERDQYLLKNSRDFTSTQLGVEKLEPFGVRVHSLDGDEEVVVPTKDLVFAVPSGTLVCTGEYELPTPATGSNSRFVYTGGFVEKVCGVLGWII